MNDAFASGSEPVRVQHAGAVCVVTLNRPEVLNAFDDAMEATLLQAVSDALADDAVSALVLTGAGRGFCAGHDMREVAEHAGAGRQAAAQRTAEINCGAQALLQADKPVVGAINGVAAGGGFALALACDLRVVSPEARFRELHLRHGMLPGMETWFLPRILGSARAFEMIATCGGLSGEEAVAHGLASRLVAAERLVAEATELAAQLGNVPREVYAYAKRAFLFGLQAPLQDTLDLIGAYRALLQRSGVTGTRAASFVSKERT